MKAIQNYINEVLVHGNFGKNLIHYTCQPETKEELREIITKRVKDEGYECDLNDIDISEITDMSHLFDTGSSFWKNDILTNFNGDISKWDVSNVKNMDGMFSGCTNFNGDISKWDVGNVENMAAMFNGCENFNGDISKWDVSNVTNMQYMFSGCVKFNKNLNNWNVSNVTNMSGMFYVCTNFNKDLNKWDVSNVTNMGYMFCGCKKFNQDLSKWKLHKPLYFLNIFKDCQIEEKNKPNFYIP